MTTNLERARALAPTLSTVCRDIHQHPELSFQEYRNAAILAGVAGAYLKAHSD